MDKQLLQQWVAENNFGELFKMLLSDKKYADYKSDILQIKGRWAKLERDQRSGLISYEQQNIELANIRKAILDLCENDFETGRQDLKTISKTKLIWIALFLTFLAFALAHLITKYYNSTQESKKEKTENTSNPPEATTYKSYDFKGHSLKMTARYAGEIEIRILSATLAEYNGDQNVFQLKFRVKDLSGFGQNFNDSNVHLVIDGLETAPYKSAIPFVEAKTEVNATADFLVEKSADAGVLVFYFGVTEPISKQEYPLKF